MSKLFIREVEGQHIQIQLDIIPNDPIDDEQGEMLLDELRRIVEKYPVPLTVGTHIKAHALENCTVPECQGVARLITTIHEKHEGTDNADQPRP